jgi:predicted O-methyltransferase YrrM
MYKIFENFLSPVYKFRYKKFIKIKNLTNGYLTPKIYKLIYDCAYRACEGSMIDIGPAQGGSTISLGLGIRDSGKNQSKIYSIEKGKNSDALKSWNNREINKNVYLKNISKYRLGNVCIPLMGDVNEVQGKIDRSQPLSLLFIDADGAIDRDFGIFYNDLLDIAPVIIDDYYDVINKFAREKYLQWTTFEEMNDYVISKGAERFVDLCPLGKEYSTYRFINYFLEKGLLVKDRIVGATFFGHKKNGAIFDPVIHGKELCEIRNQIENRYYELNPYLNK